MPRVLRLQHTSVPMPRGGQEPARAFYGQVLGLAEVTPPVSLGLDRVVWFRAGDDGHEVHLFVDESDAHGSNTQHLCLQVDDIEAFQDQLREHGVEIQETTEIKNRPRFFVRDPFQNQIELTQITGDYE